MGTQAWFKNSNKSDDDLDLRIKNDRHHLLPRVPMCPSTFINLAQVPKSVESVSKCHNVTSQVILAMEQTRFVKSSKTSWSFQGHSIQGFN